MTDETTPNVATKLLDERIEAAMQRRFGAGSSSGGGGELEKRLAGVEKKLDEMAAQIQLTRTDMAGVAKAVDVAELKGRVTQLPTTWQLLGLIFAMFGMAFALVRFGLPRV